MSEGFTKDTTLMKQEKDPKKNTPFRHQKRAHGNQHIKQMENSIVKIRRSVEEVQYQKRENRKDRE